jgi:hypothetical protein
LDPHTASLPHSPEEAWRNFPLRRLKLFADRCLGDLLEEEFAKLLESQLLPKLQQRWGDLDQEWRDLHDAVLARVRFERLQQAKPANVSEQSPVAMAEPASPRADVPRETSGDRIAVQIPGTPGRFKMMAAPVGVPQAPATIEQADELPSETLKPHWVQGAPLSPDAPFVAPALPVAPIASRKAPVEAKLTESPDDQPPEVLANTDGANGGVEQINKEGEHRQQASPQAQDKALARMQDGDEVLQHLDAANVALDKANTLEQVKELCDIATVAHIYAQRAKMGAVVENRAAAFVCRALAKLGRMMPTSRAAGKLQKHGRPQKKDPENSFSDSAERPKTLAELGVGKTKATQARKLARLPEPVFESRLKEKLDRLELSRSATLQDPPQRKEPEDARYFLALLADFEKAPENYRVQSFAGNEKLVALYQAVQEPLRRFLDAFEVEVSGTIVNEVMAP